jgi:hypothetical protein
MLITHMSQDKPLTLPAPLSRWYANDQLALALRDHVESTPFMLAQATLVDSVQPSLQGLPSDTEQRSTQLAWLAGYRDAFRDLKRLSEVHPNPEEDPTKNMLEEWSHVIPPSRLPQ